MKTITKLLITNGLIFFILLGHSKLEPSNDILGDWSFSKIQSFQLPITAVNPSISLRRGFQSVSHAMLFQNKKPVCFFSAVKHPSLVPSYFEVESYTDKAQNLDL